MPEVIYSYREWASSHGGKPVEIGGRLIFPDGASADIHGGFRQEPPSHDYSRLLLIRKYVSEHHRRAIEDFMKLKNALMGRAIFQWRENLHGPVHPDGPTALRHLKSLVERQQAELDELDQQLSATPEAIEARRRREVADEIERAEEARQVMIENEVQRIDL